MRSKILLLALAISGCTGKEAASLNKQIVCTMRGEAYFLRANVGDAIFADRMVDLDAMCKKGA